MILKKIIFTLMILFVSIQFIPYAQDHDYLKVNIEPKWDTPRTKELFMRACGDCHSNETKWPVYSVLAPFSWIVYSNVDEGREHLNISMWGISGKNKGDKAYDELKSGDMPPLSYLLLHSKARLNKEEKQELLHGLKNTF